MLLTSVKAPGPLVSNLGGGCLLEYMVFIRINTIIRILFLGDENSEVTAAQSLMLSQCIKKARDTAATLSSGHKELHGTVSKVGKSIDRVS